MFLPMSKSCYAVISNVETFGRQACTISGKTATQLLELNEIQMQFLLMLSHKRSHCMQINFNTSFSSLAEKEREKERASIAARSFRWMLTLYSVVTFLNSKVRTATPRDACLYENVSSDKKQVAEEINRDETNRIENPKCPFTCSSITFELNLFENF